MTPEEKDRLISQQRHDLSSTRSYLQSLLEDRDAKNQELVSANEEIQSANEELQSTNEELETTKEELQSSNEELHTVNDELQNRNTVLTQASNDLINLLNSVNLPVLMLSNDLNIRQFTPPAQRVMNLRPSDVGRPFGELRVKLNVDDLTPVFREVLDTLAPRETRSTGPGGALVPAACAPLSNRGQQDRRCRGRADGYRSASAHRAGASDGPRFCAVGD